MVTLTITPVANVDYRKAAVIDNAKVETRQFQDDDPIRVYDITRNRETNVIIMDVSLYDHRLVLDGVRYHILHLFSKD